MILTNIITGLISLIIGIVNILLTPIDLLISSTLPSLSSAFLAIDNYFELASQSLGFAISYSLLPPFVLQMVVLYYTFSLAFPLAIYSLKLVVKWYSHIKP